MKDALIVSMLSVLPRKTGARSLGWFARRRMSKLVVRLFIKAYKVDLSEADGTLADYPTLEALFTRSLKADTRPIADGADTIVSPVDGRVAWVGQTTAHRFEIAPGRYCDVQELVGRAFDGEMDAVVLYLAPPDYHRVHVPREGKARSWRYLPGTLWPVFPAAVRRVDELFNRNERVNVHIDTDHGPLDVVLVGAFGVGRITLTLCDLVTNAGGKASTGELPGTEVERGGLLGVFHLGSTVVLVAPPGRWAFTAKQGDVVRMGESIGHAVRQLTG